MCPGWRGTKRAGSENLAPVLRAAGFAVLAFDIRGHGDSDGPRQQMFPCEIVADIRSAVAFLSSVDGIDPRRLATIGMLTGAACALEAASEDTRIAAVVAIFPFGDGRRWMRSRQRATEWADFVRRVDADAVRRAVTGETELVEPDEILVRDAKSLRRESAETRASGARPRRLGLASAGAILAFRPEDHVHRIAPRGVMLVAIEGDSLAPLGEAERLYTRLGEPKRLRVVSGIDHYEIYSPDQLRPITQEIVWFLRDVLPAQAKLAHAPK